LCALSFLRLPHPNSSRNEFQGSFTDPAELLLEASGGSTGATRPDEHALIESDTQGGLSLIHALRGGSPVLSTRPQNAAFPPSLEYGNKCLDHPLLSGVARSATAPADAGVIAYDRAQQWEWEQHGTLLERAHRQDGAAHLVPARKRDRRSLYRPPDLLWRAADGTWQFPVWAVPITAMRPLKLDKAQELYMLGLRKKAQRELACGLLGGEARCSCRSFRVAYRCNHRFCVDCAEAYSRSLFKRAWTRLQPIAAVLCPCWPVHPGADIRNGPVMAKIDFTLRTTGLLSTAGRQRELGRSIKQFFRVCESEFRIPRDRYGCAVHMETSQEANGRTKRGREVLGNMSHAHGVYVGPWLPNKKRQLARIWRQVSPDGSFSVSIKRAENLAQALAHATKYPRKLVRQSTPARLAQLEKLYGRVRMFRLLGAFDKRIAERILTAAAGGEAFHFQQFKRVSTCPTCGTAIALSGGWRFLGELAHLEDPEEVRRRIGRERVFAGPHGPPGTEASP
jgi:hypothetical protein